MTVDIPPRLYSAILASLDLAIMRSPETGSLKGEFSEALCFLESNLHQRLERVSAELSMFHRRQAT